VIAGLARGITLTGLALSIAILLWPPATAEGAVGALPLAILLVAGIRPARRWGGWVAALMIPYLAVAAMNILAGPMSRAPAVAFGLATVLAFLAGLGWLRSTGATLKG
jgi:hypothetical protein